MPYVKCNFIKLFPVRDGENKTLIVAPPGVQGILMSVCAARVCLEL